MRAIQSTASMKRRLLLPLRPGSDDFPRQCGLHLRPLGVRQHKAIHSKLESQIAYRGNPISQQALAQMTGASSRSMDRFEPVVAFLLYSLLLECHGR